MHPLTLLPPWSDRASWVVTEIWERAEPGRRVADAGAGDHTRYGREMANAELRVGVVDVLVLRREAGGWRVLVLERGEGTRCTGAWEIVHGRLDAGELPEAGALREVREETGLPVERLYSIRAHPFYLVPTRTVQVAVVFAAIVGDAPLALGGEHVRAEWLPVEDALARVAWPSERQTIRETMELLAGGDAGPLEDVLRVV